MRADIEGRCCSRRTERRLLGTILRSNLELRLSNLSRTAVSPFLRPEYRQLLTTMNRSFPVKITSISSVEQETSAPVNSRSPNLTSKLSFSLILSLPTATREDCKNSLLDLDAIHAAQLAEWSDGIKVLKDGRMTSQDSANYVQASSIHIPINGQPILIPGEDLNRVGTERQVVGYHWRWRRDSRKRCYRGWSVWLCNESFEN